MNTSAAPIGAQPANGATAPVAVAAHLKNKKKKKQSKVIPKPIVKPITREFKSRKDAHEVIERFHELQKRLEQLKSSKDPEASKQIEEVEKKMESLGGIEGYQKASIYGETFKAFNTSKWVVKCLSEKGLRPPKGDAIKGEYAKKIKTLDVGAINNHFKGIKWIDLTAIDINPMDPGVIKCDFFDFEAPNSSFDVIVLSLVINYLGDARKRGLMLRRCAELLKCKKDDSMGGLMFLVIPLACIENSRYLTNEILTDLLKNLGFSVLEHKTSKKLAFYMLELTEKKASSEIHKISLKKHVIKSGGDKNNFAIIFDGDYTRELAKQEDKLAADKASGAENANDDEDSDSDVMDVDDYNAKGPGKKVAAKSNSKPEKKGKAQPAAQKKANKSGSSSTSDPDVNMRKRKWADVDEGSAEDDDDDDDDDEQETPKPSASRVTAPAPKRRKTSDGGRYGKKPRPSGASRPKQFQRNMKPHHQKQRK